MDTRPHLPQEWPGPHRGVMVMRCGPGHGGSQPMRRSRKPLARVVRAGRTRWAAAHCTFLQDCAATVAGLQRNVAALCHR